MWPTKLSSGADIPQYSWYGHSNTVFLLKTEPLDFSEVNPNQIPWSFPQWATGYLPHLSTGSLSDYDGVVGLLRLTQSWRLGERNLRDDYHRILPQMTFQSCSGLGWHWRNASQVFFPGELCGICDRGWHSWIQASYSVNEAKEETHRLVEQQ